MKNLICLISVFLFAGSAFLAGQTIPEKKSSTFKNEPAIENIMLARQLMVYGYDHNDPLSLLMSARLFLEWPPQSLITEGTSIKSGVEVQKVNVPFDVTAMLNDAVKFSGGDESIQKMADEIAAGSSKGAKKGPMYGEYVLSGQEYITFEVKFTGNEVAIVGAAGDGNADIDLYIYTKDGILVVADDSESYECLVMWFPEKTANFLIKVVNRGMNSTRFGIAAN